MRLGVCWYPDQWPESDWVDDVARMADLGLQVVRIGEFAWSRMEPRRGRLDLGWMDRAVALLADHGLRVVIGTPTATPPVWLLRERPDVRIVGSDGRMRPYGSRRHTCPTSPAYREESARIVEVLARQYGKEATLDAWQVDNEPGNHDSARCWCDACHAAFRDWLAARFGDVDTLNQRWGQAFWSMTYPDFAAVDLPAPTMTVHNPSLELAHRRFASGQVVDGLAAQRRILRDLSPDVPTFTNLYMGDLDIDARAVHRLHGLGAIDNYPHGLPGPEAVAFHLDLARGAALGPGEGVEARGGRAWVVEQQPGPVNWTGDNPAVPPGQVGAWIDQAADHGIHTLLVFRWRMARAGQEQHHAALLTHDRRETPAYAEVKAAARRLPRRAAERDRATAAVVIDYADAWILQVVPQVDGSSHRQMAVAAHQALRAAGHVVDVVGADADLSGYQVVALPGLQQATDDRIATIEQALAAGVTVLVGPRSLVRDGDAVWVDQAAPAGLVELLGAAVVHAGSPAGWPRDPKEVSTVQVDGTAGPLDAGGWIETLHVSPDDDDEGCRILATAHGGPLAGDVVAVARGRLAYVGAASPSVWLEVLRVLQLHLS